MKKYANNIRIAFVYYLYKDNNIIYIGRTTDLSKRIYQHSINKDFDEYSFILSNTDNYINIERLEIKKLKPILNLIEYKNEVNAIKKEKTISIDSSFIPIYNSLILNRKINFSSRKKFAEFSKVSLRTIDELEVFNKVSSTSIIKIIKGLKLELTININEYNSLKYEQALDLLNEKHAKIFTLKELSEHLNVSVRKLIDFKSGKVIDFWLLSQYASIIGFRIEFTLHG